MEEKIIGWLLTSLIAGISAISGVKLLYERRMAVAEKRVEFIKKLSFEAYHTSRNGNYSH